MQKVAYSKWKKWCASQLNGTTKWTKPMLEMFVQSMSELVNELGTMLSKMESFSESRSKRYRFVRIFNPTFPNFAHQRIFRRTRAYHPSKASRNRSIHSTSSRSSSLGKFGQVSGLLTRFIILIFPY